MSHLDHFVLGLFIGLACAVGGAVYVVYRRLRAGHVIRVERNLNGRKVVGLSIGNRRATLTPTVAVEIADALLREAHTVAPGLRKKPAKVRGRGAERALRAQSDVALVTPYEGHTGKTPRPRVPS